MRIGLVNHATAEVRQLEAAVEHVATRSHSISIPLITHIDGTECWAIVEHMFHIRNISRVEAIEVEAGERLAGAEHVAHIRHIGGVKATEIQAGKRFAVSEQASHIRHIWCVELIQPTDCRERSIV